MKKLLLFLAASAILSSCCIRHKTFAQSDRFDTHKPAWQVIECIPCAGLQHRNENFVWLEAMGPSGKLTGGVELGHNFSAMRLYGSAGIGWWPRPLSTTTFTAQAGIIGRNPNKLFRPEAGVGFAGWLFRTDGETIAKLHPATGFPSVGTGNYSSWQVYGGLRIMIPQSTLNLSLRVYRLQGIHPGNCSGFYPGIVCGFRF